MSASLEGLDRALAEIVDLRRADESTDGASSATLKLARAVGRSQVVLLSSHFERYLHAVNEEAIAFVNASGVSAATLPDSLKVLHSKQPIDHLAETGWEQRAEHLTKFVTSDGWLWGVGEVGTLTPARLLAWMKAPKPESLVRYYRYWGIQNIFEMITRSPVTKNRLWLGIQELVDKRNNIAHGDFLAQATQLDIQRYLQSVRVFCGRADLRLAAVITRLCRGARPW
jgi:hypothetical protein